MGNSRRKNGLAIASAKKDRRILTAAMLKKAFRQRCGKPEMGFRTLLSLHIYPSE